MPRESVEVEDARRDKTFRTASINSILNPADLHSADSSRETNSFRPDGGLSYGEVVLNLFIACIGSAICIFPKKTQEAGYVAAFPLLALGCALTYECGRVMSLACDYCEVLFGADASDYESLALNAGGPTRRCFLIVSKSCALLGLVIVFMQLVVDGVTTFFPPELRRALPHTKASVRFFIVLPAFVFMSMFRDLKQLAKLNRIGIAAVALEIVGLLAGAGMHSQYAQECQTSKDAEEAEMIALNTDFLAENLCTWYSAVPPAGQEVDFIGSYLASCIFAFATLSTVPRIRSQMSEKHLMPSALARALFAVFMTYTVIIFVGYNGYGDTAPANLVDAIGADFKVVGRMTATAVLMNCFISAPLVIFVIVTAFENSGDDEVRTPFTMYNINFRVLLMIILGIVGHFIPDIGAFISLISATFYVCNNIFFPMAFFYMARRKAFRGGMRVDSLPLYMLAIHAAICVAGLFILIFGVRGSFALFAKASIAKRNTTTTVPESERPTL